MYKYRHTMLALSLFFIGFFCGHLLTPFADSRNEQPLEASYSRQHQNSAKPINERLRLRETMFYRNDCEVFTESEKGLIEQADSAVVPTSYTDLKSRIDRLPELLINQQLELIFDQEYLDSVDDPRAFANKLVDIALADGDIQYLETAATEGAVIEIEFSLSPLSGLRQFSRLTEIEQFDRVFTHFISSADYPNLMVRWQHRETGEILYFSPIKLSADQRAYISLNPKRGWLPGSYQISLYDLNNNQKLVGSSDYLIDTVLEVEEHGLQADKDVIEDLLSSGLAVPKAH